MREVFFGYHLERVVMVRFLKVIDMIPFTAVLSALQIYQITGSVNIVAPIGFRI
jgi:hypothetical protein